ncbi:hypothetical protein FD02_GL000574 [Lacticaseibacillus nasuensis JCM 17158]|uniref:Uncharacterized protein n=2 Tax=Lacticaseibacillus TaxID=2759736 RepID=A0A0R1JHA3_9LACO|nr:hypothetical protein FD02_GL000574 [Lacticaseibacillus nasuensis JCM 17158]
MMLTACGSNNESEKTASGATKMTFWTFVDAQGNFYKDAAKAWNKTHKQKIALKVSVLPYATEYQKLTVALRSGSGAPDIVDVELSQTATQLKGKNPTYYPLNAELKPYMNKLVQSRLDNYKKGKNYYGLDYHVGTTVTYYNTDILKKAGVDYTKIKTWADYTKAGEQVKAKTGKYMTELEYSASFQLDAMTSQQHADYIKGSKADLDNAAVTRALQMQKDWIYKDKIARAAVGGNLDNDQYFAEMNKGNVASVTMPAWYMERMADHMPKLSQKIAIAPMPVFKSNDLRSAGGGGTGTMVTTQARNKKLAAKFVVWSKASRNQAVKIWTKLGFDPVRKDIWTEPVMKSSNKYTKYFGKNIFDTFSALADQTTSVSQTKPLSPDVNDALLKNVLPSTIMHDKESAATALKKATAALNQ